MLIEGLSQYSNVTPVLHSPKLILSQSVTHEYLSFQMENITCIDINILKWWTNVGKATHF